MSDLPRVAATPDITRWHSFQAMLDRQASELYTMAESEEGDDLVAMQLSAAAREAANLADYYSIRIKHHNELHRQLEGSLALAADKQRIDQHEH